jgi:hypothetical protein
MVSCEPVLTKVREHLIYSCVCGCLSTLEVSGHRTQMVQKNATYSSILASTKELLPVGRAGQALAVLTKSSQGPGPCGQCQAATVSMPVSPFRCLWARCRFPSLLVLTTEPLLCVLTEQSCLELLWSESTINCSPNMHTEFKQSFFTSIFSFTAKFWGEVSGQVTPYLNPKISIACSKSWKKDRTFLSSCGTWKENNVFGVLSGRIPVARSIYFVNIYHISSFT